MSVPVSVITKLNTCIQQVVDLQTAMCLPCRAKLGQSFIKQGHESGVFELSSSALNMKISIPFILC